MACHTNILPQYIFEVIKGEMDYVKDLENTEVVSKFQIGANPETKVNPLSLDVCRACARWTRPSFHRIACSSSCRKSFIVTQNCTPITQDIG